MRKLEILFLASLALGGYREILTPYVVFALQTLALFFLIAIKFHCRHFARTSRITDLLFPLIFVLYIIFRSVADLSPELISLGNIEDFLKPIIVLSCLTLPIFRFQLVDDLCDETSGRWHLSHWVVVFGALSTLYLVGLHVASFQLGRLGSGLYFSTFYVFATMLAFSTLLCRENFFSQRKDIGLLGLLLLRSFVDLRRTPVVVIGGFIASFFMFRVVRLVFVGIEKHKLLTTPNLIRLGVLVAILVCVYSFIVSGNFNRLNLDAIKFALFDVRLLDISIALEKVFSVNPIFGIGPIFSFDLHYSAQVHSLPAAIFVSYGWIGLAFFLILMIRLITDTIGTFAKIGRKAEAKFSFLLASVFYMVFFTFSARGLEIEVFSMFGLALAVGMKKT